MLRLEARNVGNTKIKILNGCFFSSELDVSSPASWVRSGERGEAPAGGAHEEREKK